MQRWANPSAQRIKARNTAHYTSLSFYEKDPIIFVASLGWRPVESPRCSQARTTRPLLFLVEHFFASHLSRACTDLRACPGTCDQPFCTFLLPSFSQQRLQSDRPYSLNPLGPSAPKNSKKWSPKRPSKSPPKPRRQAANSPRHRRKPPLSPPTLSPRRLFTSRSLRQSC